MSTKDKDRFDEILQRKLGDMHVQPPADMWARIESSLKNIEAAETDQSAGRIGEPVQGRPLSLRRLRRMRLGYASAAAAILIMMMVGVRISLDNSVDDMPVAPLADDLINNRDNISDGRDRVIADNIAEIPDSRPATVKESMSNYARRAMFPVTDIDQTKDSDAGIESDIKTEIVAVNANDHGLEPNKEVSGTGSDVKETTTAVDSATNNKDEKTSDKRKDGVPVDWTKVLAEESRRSRRASPLKFSLFAADLGGGSGSDNQYGNYKANSNLTVDEVVDDPNIFTVNAKQQEDGSQAKLKHKIPITVGANINIGLTDRLSIETGLSYSYLSSEGEEMKSFNYTTKQKLHYLGIPVNLKYDFFKSRFVDIYASAGGMIEKCVSGVSEVSVSANQFETKSMDVKGVQPSVGLHVGGELNIAKGLGLYVEPGMSYYFKNDKQPENYRTNHQLNFSLRAGLRIKLKN